jgi:hypothetical protein
MIEHDVTFFGEAGHRQANVYKYTSSKWCIDCQIDDKLIITKTFKTKEEADKEAMKFVWEKEYGTI